MTDHTPEDGGTPPPFKNVEDQAHFERAPAPREPVRDSGDPNLAFEAAPRTPLPPATTPDPRALSSSPPAPSGPVAPLPSFEAVPKPPPSAEPPLKLPAFEAVPASVAVAQQRLSKPTIGIRPEAVDVAGPLSPGGSGWNIRRREAWRPKRGHPAPAGGPAWQTRTLPNANRDRSAWMVPEAKRIRTISRRRVVGTALVLVLVAIVAFAAYLWFAGQAHPAHTSRTSSPVGALPAIDMSATASGSSWTVPTR
ncbi:MAG: hypothetical protein WAL84_16800 [Candidatus Dormiibacterota bacterium]